MAMAFCGLYHLYYCMSAVLQPGLSPIHSTQDDGGFTQNHDCLCLVQCFSEGLPCPCDGGRLFVPFSCYISLIVN